MVKVAAAAGDMPSVGGKGDARDIAIVSMKYCQFGTTLYVPHPNRLIG
jgi:hypothetical protein